MTTSQSSIINIYGEKGKAWLDGIVAWLLLSFPCGVVA
jgi:hypothetical protein